MVKRRALFSVLLAFALLDDESREMAIIRRYLVSFCFAHLTSLIASTFLNWHR